MAFDYKKEYKEFYLPKNKPHLVDVPKMNFIAVQGRGNPNAKDGPYQQVMNILYGLAYTIKMSKKGDHKIDGYFDYVLPPLEGFWWLRNDDGDVIQGIDYNHKEWFEWISLIRLPEFVTKQEFDWAVDSATKRKQIDFSKAEFLTIKEGLCVQCMHRGPFDDEPATIDIMHKYMNDNNLSLDISEKRHHHEIYLSDARRCKPENLKTVIRIPVCNN